MLYNTLQASIKASFQHRRAAYLFRTPQYLFVYIDSLPEKQKSTYFFHLYSTMENPKLPFFLY